jgi:hypothetical protein
VSAPNVSDPAAVAVALAELRGTMETGFANLDGKLNLLAQRGDQSDRRLDDLEHRLDAVERGETDRQRRQEGRLSALEENRWPWKLIVALAAVAGAVAAVVALWQH